MHRKSGQIETTTCASECEKKRTGANTSTVIKTGLMKILMTLKLMTEVDTLCKGLNRSMTYTWKIPMGAQVHMKRDGVTRLIANRFAHGFV